MRPSIIYILYEKKMHRLETHIHTHTNKRDDQVWITLWADVELPYFTETRHIWHQSLEKKKKKKKKKKVQ